MKEESKTYRGKLKKIALTTLNFEPIEILTIFDVPINTKRGGHAHFNCVQAINVVQGSINLYLEYATGEKVKRKVTEDDLPVEIPLLCWAEQTYLEVDTIVQVFCSKAYDELDYIRSKKLYHQLLNNNNNLP